VLVIATLVALLMAIGLAWSTTRAITRPLAVLEAGAHALARGDFQHRIALTGTHELADLGSTFNYAADRIGELFAERDRAGEQLRQSRADLARVARVTTMGELAASLAHEIRQPITAAMTDVKTCVRWLSRDEPHTGEAKAAAARAITDITRASEIIGRIQSLFKKDDDKRETLDVNDLVDEMVPLLRSEAHRYGVSIQTDLDRGVPKVSADRIQVHQVLMNLMLNGIEAMNETRGSLVVASQANGHDVLVSVSDSGVGLPRDGADQIFQAFFTTKPDGTGMGLSISRSIIQSHGGRLWADANASGGATFFFTLPAVPRVSSQ
jgi:C4-dicarboxylate-specific signal transduction histidine kinase